MLIAKDSPVNSLLNSLKYQQTMLIKRLVVVALQFIISFGFCEAQLHFPRLISARIHFWIYIRLYACAKWR